MDYEQHPQWADRQEALLAVDETLHSLAARVDAVSVSAAAVTWVLSTDRRPTQVAAAVAQLDVTVEVRRLHGDTYRVRVARQDATRTRTAVWMPRPLADDVATYRHQHALSAADMLTEALDSYEPHARQEAARRLARGLPATGRTRRTTSPDAQLWLSLTQTQRVRLEDVARLAHGGNRSATVTSALSYLLTQASRNSDVRDAGTIDDLH